MSQNFDVHRFLGAHVRPGSCGRMNMDLPFFEPSFAWCLQFGRCSQEDILFPPLRSIMADSSHTGSRQWMAAKTSYQSHNEETRCYENAADTYTATSRSNQALIPLLTLLFGFITIGLCIAAIIWLCLKGPTRVPGHDRRCSRVVGLSRMYLIKIDFPEPALPLIQYISSPCCNQ